MFRRRPVTTVVVLILLAITAGLVSVSAWAGPIDPPPGPITSTYKTLTEVEPRTAVNLANTPGDASSLFSITHAGSYYLTGNIDGEVGKHGIAIAASGVTLDLNGFDLAGVAGSLNGVSLAENSLVNISVINGSVRNWGGAGVDLWPNTVQFSANNCRVQNVLASNNVGTGIIAARHCTISNCSAAFNATGGIRAHTGSRISDCSAVFNATGGISIIGGDCTLVNCTVRANTGRGMNTGSGCTIINCAAYFNTGGGLFVDFSSTIAGCTVRGNTLDGIACTDDCSIRDNACESNGDGFAGDGAGIHATGSGNRIDGNNCTGADRGIDIDAAGNIIMRNTCRGNANNWDVVAGNVIRVVNASIAEAVTGDSGGSNIGADAGSESTANFTY